MTLHCDLCGNRVERITVKDEYPNYGIYVEVHNYEQCTDKKSDECDVFIICKDCAREIFGPMTKRFSSTLNLDYQNMTEYDKPSMFDTKITRTIKEKKEFFSD
jgi:hypothetical protein